MTRPAAGLSAELARAHLRTLRPRDIRSYTQPSVQIMRLERRGLMNRLAHGYYAVVPQDRIGTYWKPTVESAAAGIAAADFGGNASALMECQRRTTTHGVTAGHRLSHRRCPPGVVAISR
jgi:hypothetical protein